MRFKMKHLNGLVCLIVVAAVLVFTVGAIASEGKNSTAPSRIGFTKQVINPNNPNQVQSILLYADDYQRTPGDHYIEQALNWLGLTYTAVYDDPVSFGTQLNAGGWDLVLVDHNNYFSIGDYWDDILNFINAGGKCLISTFDIDLSNSSPTTLFSSLGITPNIDLDPAAPVYSWNPAHPIWTDPRGVPDFTTMTDAYGDNGDKVYTGGGANPVGGFTAGTAAGESGVIVAAGGNAIINSFLVCENLENLDGDGTADAVELYINEISFLHGGGGGVPDISLNPTSFNFIAPQGGDDSGVLNIGNTGDGNLEFDISWLGTTYQGTSFRSRGSVNGEFANSASPLQQRNPQENKSKQASVNVIKPDFELSFYSEDAIILEEGFEGGVLPPPGWTKIDGSSSPGDEPAHWRIGEATEAYDGNYSAVCPWGYNLDEWLISPPLDLSGGGAPAMSFWWMSSYYWHIDPYDNGDLFVKVSVDGGTNWDELWTFGNIGVWDSWVWMETVLDLSAYATQTNVLIAFNIVANDNAFIHIDQVTVSGEGGSLDWISYNPTTGTVSPGNTQPVDVQANSVVGGSVLPEGLYTGTLLVNSNDPDEPTRQVPVTFTVGGDPPDINVTPPSFTFHANPEGSDDGVMTVSNVAPAGADNLNWNISHQGPALGGNQTMIEEAREAVVEIDWTADRKESAKGNPISTSSFHYDAVGDIVSQIPFPAGVATINGLAWGNNALWASDWTNNQILKLDGNTGAVLQSYALPAGASTPSDLAHDGTYLYLYDFGVDLIYQIDPATGVDVSSFTDPLGADEGLTFDGTHLVRASTDDIVFFTTTGTVVNTIPGPGVYCDGLAWDGSTLWYNSNVGEVYQIDPATGAVLQSFFEPPGASENGLAFDGQYLRYDDSNALSIYSIDIGFSGGCPWLTANPTAGTVAPGNSQNVQVTASAVGLTTGTYNCELLVNSNDPDEPTVTVPVTFIVNGGPCTPPYIKAPDDAMATAGMDFTIDITILDNPNPIDAFGFRLTFCSDKLSLVSVEKGDLSNHYSFFQASENSPGEITIGGFDATAIPTGSDGSIARVTFHVDQCSEGESCVLGIHDLADDLIGLNICQGLWTCGIPCLLGDVNDDGFITPGDALCAFQIYLNGGTPPPGECDNPCALYAADANCDGAVTPGDALIIFNAYLGGLVPPLECPSFGMNLTKTVNREISLAQLTGSAYDEVTFALKVNNPLDLSAFGIQLGFPEDALIFDRVTPGELTDGWEVFGGLESLAGVVNIGGFDGQAIELTDSGILAYITFKVKEGVESQGEIWLYNGVDDLDGAQLGSGEFTTITTDVRSLHSPGIPDEYGLNQNYPNPFNMETEIIYQIPEAVFVELEIYNSMGQKIRSLVSENQSAGRYAARWDGRDEAGNFVSSGIYLYRLKAADFLSIKKLTLVK